MKRIYTLLSGIALCVPVITGKYQWECNDPCDKSGDDYEDCVTACERTSPYILPHCDPSKWKLPIDGKYNTTGYIDPNKLNVHLIPHTHDDPGWLIAVDEYYTREVQYILDTVVEELLLNSDRKFAYVEQAFFQRWWAEQSNEMKNIVKKLIANGQFDLTVNGGWCMHDEATPHYTAMLDQTSYGHQLLKEEFNISPRIGWQIDPFGHSSTQGSLLSGGVGFDALYFARIDYEDYWRRFSSKNMEMIWRPSKSRGKAMQVFTGVIINHYGAPEGFDYNHNNGIQDDPLLHDFDVCDKIDTFVADALMRGSATKGNHIFVPMGDDFAYQNAHKWFKNMDKLIHYANQNGSINVLYSNLSYYTDLKRAENLEWEVKTDDFFPYGTGEHQYWSGFFTSRPTLKRFARVSNQVLQQVWQIDAIYQSHHATKLEKLWRAVGLVQHHDGLSGTEKQAVANDYALRLNDGLIDTVNQFNEVMFIIGEKESYKFCLQANISVCDVSTSNEKFEVFIHNSLPHKTVQTISIPVKNINMKVQVMNGAATVRNSYVVKTIPVHPNAQVEAPYKLIFSIEQQPLMDSRFLVEEDKQNDNAMSSFENSLENLMHSYVGDYFQADSAIKSLENDLIRVEIDTHTGGIVSVTNKEKKITIPVTTSFGYYQSFAGHDNSGAYVFRPDSKTVHTIGKATQIDVDAYGKQYSSNKPPHLAFNIGDWVNVEYKLNDNDEFVEIEWTVGSIPIHDKKGKEVIMRFDTGKKIESKKTWYTDSNGVEFVERIRNFRETWNLTIKDDQDFVAANYFPITTGVYLKDSQYQLNVVTDRAQGASSLEDGQLEVMVHRRILADDEKGVSEHLNETETYYDAVHKKEVTEGLKVRGNFYLNVDSAKDGMRSIRKKMEKQFYVPMIAYRKPVNNDEFGDGKLPWLSINAFPENVGLVTLKELTKSCIFTRLIHLFAVDEHDILSKPVSFDFAKYFSVENSKLDALVEMTLTGTMPISEARQPRNMEWKAVGEDLRLDSDTFEHKSKLLQGSSVELQAMEIRAFKVCFKKSHQDIEDTTSTKVNQFNTEDEELKIDHTTQNILPVSDILAVE